MCEHVFMVLLCISSSNANIVFIWWQQMVVAVNTLMTIDAYMHHWARSPLVLVKAWPQFAAKGLPHPILTFFQLLNKLWIKRPSSSFKKMQWKFCWQTVTHFVWILCKMLAILFHSQCFKSVTISRAFTFILIVHMNMINTLWFCYNMLHFL